MGIGKKLDLPKELLEEMYETMTIEQIALELGVHERTIRRRFSEYGIETGKHTNPQFIKRTTPKKMSKFKKATRYKDKEDFQEVYSELRSLSLVAKHYNISITTALRWKTIHGIDNVLGTSEYSTNRRGGLYTNKEWLEEMYSNHTITEIASVCGCHPTTIHTWMHKFGIRTRTVQEQRDLKSGNGNRTILGSNNILKKENYLENIPLNLNRKLVNKICGIVGSCQCCGYEEVLDVHHKDSNHYNNDPYNLWVLCPNCHAQIHRDGKDLESMITNTINWIDMI